MTLVNSTRMRYKRCNYVPPEIYVHYFNYLASPSNFRRELIRAYLILDHSKRFESSPEKSTGSFLILIYPLRSKKHGKHRK